MELTFIIVALATWRMSNLVCNETGPFHVFAKIRAWGELMCDKSGLCYAFHLDELLTCEYCASVWIGTAWGILMYIGKLTGVNYAFWLAVPFALSTVTIMLKYVHQILRRYSE